MRLNQSNGGRDNERGEEHMEFSSRTGEEKLCSPDIAGSARWILDDATPVSCSCSLPNSVFS